MRFPSKTAISFCLLLSLFASSVPFATAAIAKDSLVSQLPSSERSMFILDISNSTNVKSNWNKSLRPSIIKNLRSQPFGYPFGKGTGTAKPPVDISVSAITANSIDAPVFPLITVEDSNKIWGLIDEIGTNPTQKRLELISKDIFGGNGAFTVLSETFERQPIVVPDKNKCRQSTVKTFSGGIFMRDLSADEKKKSASTLCDLTVSIASRIKAIDSYFENPDCGQKGACSDVIGALLSTSYAAADLYEKSPNSQFCIAIASDMLNNSPGLKTESLLNTRRVAENAVSISDAKEKGVTVAKLVGISFPKKMPIRIFVLGQGSGKNPISLEKNAMLSAYWQGFFESAGIKNSKPTPSLDQACSRSSSSKKER